MTRSLSVAVLSSGVVAPLSDPVIVTRSAATEEGSAFGLTLTVSVMVCGPSTARVPMFHVTVPAAGVVRAGGIRAVVGDAVEKRIDDRHVRSRLYCRRSR